MVKIEADAVGLTSIEGSLFSSYFYFNNYDLHLIASVYYQVVTNTTTTTTTTVLRPFVRDYPGESVPEG